MPVTLHLKLTGTVENSKTIVGKLSWKGCMGNRTGHTTYKIPLGKPL